MYAGGSDGVLQSTRTRLVARGVGTLSGAHAALESTGRNNNEVCMVVTPHFYADPCFYLGCCLFAPLLSVPSGKYVLWQRWGENKGQLTPGGHCCWPVCNHVSHIVSKSLVVYNAHSKLVPTKDNVFVDIDLSVNLRVGQTIEHAETFIYAMGPQRLAAYLNFQVEESIRELVYGVHHTQVNDLRSEFAGQVLETLKSKCARFGIEVVGVKLTNVKLPMELQQRLEKTTSFKTRIEEDAKEHQHNVLKLENAHALKTAEIVQQYAIQKQQIEAQALQYQIKMDERTAQCESERNVQCQQAHSATEVAVARARGEIGVAEHDGRASKEELVSSTRIGCERALREAQNTAAMQTKAAEATETAAVHLAKAREAEAEAQGTAAEKNAEKRLFEQRLKLADIDASIAARGRKMISGADGGKLMKGFVRARDKLAAPASGGMDRT